MNDGIDITLATVAMKVSDGLGAESKRTNESFRWSKAIQGQQRQYEVANFIGHLNVWNCMSRLQSAYWAVCKYALVELDNLL